MNKIDDNDISVQRFVEYIQIKTVHPEPDYPGAIEFLKKYAAELSLDFLVINIDEKRPAAVLTWRSDSDEKTILLNSHIDVVPVFEENWIVPPFSGAIVDGKIYGRGTQDMKCVGIQYLEAIRRLKTANFQPNRTIHCLFVPDEEIGGMNGMKLLLDMEQFKALNVGFVLDEGLASENDIYQIYYGDRSALWVQFILRGYTGHGSRLIENTVGAKVQFITNEMLKFRENEKQRLEDSLKTDNPLQLGDITTINMTMISGGVQANVVPDQFTLTFDCRIGPNGYFEFRDFLENLVRETPKASDDDVKINFLADSGDLLLTDIKSSSWWLDAVKKSLNEMKCQLNWTVFPAATDSRYLRNAGYPAIGFSPINHTPILLHDHNEYLPTDVFLHGIDIYISLISNLTK